VEFINNLFPKSRRWQKSIKQNSKTIARAASLQARQLRINSPIEEAQKIANIYNLHTKRMHWEEFGDISFHLLIRYPPDLAYFTLYAFRELPTTLQYDPVPLVLKAVEMIAYLNPSVFTTSLENLKGNEELDKLINSSAYRARKAAKILVRELSVTPLQFASGIFKSTDNNMKHLILEELKSFNPNAADIILKSSAQSLFTKVGIIKFISRLLFGK